MANSRVTPATMHGTTLSTLQSTNQVRDVEKRLLMIYPNETPFLALTNQMSEASDGKAMIAEWGEQPDPPRFVTVTGDTSADGTTVTAAGTTISITPTGAVVAHEILQDERSGEDIYITANASGVLTVGQRGAYQTGCTPLTLPVGTQLRIVGSAKEENATHSDPKGIIPTLLQNYYQTFESDYAYSTLAKAIDYYLSLGQGQPGTDAIMIMRDFKRKLEWSSLFGHKLNGTSSGPNSGYLGKMGGLFEWCDSVNNSHDVGGAFTFPNFMDIMADHARVGNGGDYTGFACTSVCNIMQRWSLDYDRCKFLQGQSGVFGLKFMEYQGTNWKLRMMQHEAFEESDVRKSQLLIVKNDTNKRKFMRGLGLKTNKGIESPQNTGKHGYQDQITATMTLEALLPESNCYLKGITS